MMENVRGTVHGKIIELEQPLPLPDGSAVTVFLELIMPSDEERRRRILDLSGAWKNDPTITRIFHEIERKRRRHTGREVRMT